MPGSFNTLHWEWQLWEYQKARETVRDLLPFLITHLNSTTLPSPRVLLPPPWSRPWYFPPTLTSTLLYPISVLLQKSAHTQPCFLTGHLCLNSVKPRFSLHILLKVLQSHANPMAISQFSSSLQCLISWHPLLLYTSKYYILKVLLADNYFYLSFLLLFLSGSVFYVLFSVLSFPHPASFIVQTGIPQSSFLALTSPEFCFSKCPINI